MMTMSEYDGRNDATADDGASKGREKNQSTELETAETPPS